jgi:hypothetical protein
MSDNDIFAGVSGSFEATVESATIESVMGAVASLTRLHVPTCDIIARPTDEPDEWTELVDCRFGDSVEAPDGTFSVPFSCVTAWRWVYNERSGGCIADPVVSFGVDFAAILVDAVVGQ